jgi:hypothetical protein
MGTLSSEIGRPIIVEPYVQGYMILRSSRILKTFRVSRVNRS